MLPATADASVMEPGNNPLMRATASTSVTKLDDGQMMRATKMEKEREGHLPGA